MITIPGELGKDLCDPHLTVSRRDLLRIGGSSMLGLGLANMFKLQARAAQAGHVGGPGWGKAKHVILLMSPNWEAKETRRKRELRKTPPLPP